MAKPVRFVSWVLQDGDRVLSVSGVALPPVTTAAEAWNAAALVGDAIERALLAEAGLWPDAGGPPPDAEIDRDQVLAEQDAERRRILHAR